MARCDPAHVSQSYVCIPSFGSLNPRVCPSTIFGIAILHTCRKKYDQVTQNCLSKIHPECKMSTLKSKFDLIQWLTRKVDTHYT